MGFEDDKEPDVLIEILAKNYRNCIIISIVWVILFFILNVAFVFDWLKATIIFLSVGASINLLFWKKLLCPFCRKCAFWIPDRSDGRSGKWPDGYFTPFLHKRCPQCSRSLRVKKE